MMKIKTESRLHHLCNPLFRTLDLRFQITFLLINQSSVEASKSTTSETDVELRPHDPVWLIWRHLQRHCPGETGSCRPRLLRGRLASLLRNSQLNSEYLPGNNLQEITNFARKGVVNVVPFATNRVPRPRQVNPHSSPKIRSHLSNRKI